MLKPLGARDGLTRYGVGAKDDVDLAVLAAVMSEAWAADYTDHLRPDFGEHYLHHALAGSSWVAVLVCTEAGEPVGFELALERIQIPAGFANVVNAKDIQWRYQSEPVAGDLVRVGPKERHVRQRRANIAHITPPLAVATA